VRLRALAPAKVNLCLFLGPTRSDGRHELVTVFQALSLADVLELTVLEPPAADRVVCAGIEGENLASRALAVLRERGWGGPPVAISITKRIPVAAGMAGGSADAAAALRLAMAIAPGRPEELDAVAASLGSDVPSQLMPGLAIGTGAGELVEPYAELGPHAFVILRSRHELATPDVFREADRLELPRTGDELVERYRSVGRALKAGGRLPEELIVNDLEPAAISLCPSIAETLDAVRGTGAEQALVCGSGPTVVGLWWGEDAQRRASEAADALAEQDLWARAATPVTAAIALPVPV
jgi:4-diphosphocytidyl-2-C-methyl-D-erythritol kinase